MLPDLQVAVPEVFAADDTVSGIVSGTWTCSAPWMQIVWNDGTTDKVFVQKGHDW